MLPDVAVGSSVLVGSTVEEGSREVIFRIGPSLEHVLLAVAVGSTVGVGSTVVVGSWEVMFRMSPLV